jgi:membrane-associated phospholipid phosphatase
MKSRSPRQQTHQWVQALAQRVQTLWVIKATGTTVGISGFFFLYFWVLRSMAPVAVTVPMTAVDRWVGVSELALVPYISLWLYVSLGPALASNMASLRMYIAGALAIAGLGLATYWLFPTTTPTFGVDWADYPALQILKATDLGGNAFPSLHVAFAAYSGVVIASELRSLRAPAWVRAGNWVWCAAIVYSTLATRQHVLIDVVGGLLLTGLAVRMCRTRAMERLFRGSVHAVSANQPRTE